MVLAGDVFYDEKLAAQGLEWLETLQHNGADVRDSAGMRQALSRSRGWFAW